MANKYFEFEVSLLGVEPGRSLASKKCHSCTILTALVLSVKKNISHSQDIPNQSIETKAGFVTHMV